MACFSEKDRAREARRADRLPRAPSRARQCLRVANTQVLPLAHRHVFLFSSRGDRRVCPFAEKRRRWLFFAGFSSIYAVAGNA